ncbi:MAG: hypothetical protein M5U28_48960 [Sandaracinaceae bacterium]|nr:hypothetical protein [Sandaracinaceae bacterium]
MLLLVLSLVLVLVLSLVLVLPAGGVLPPARRPAGRGLPRRAVCVRHSALRSKKPNRGFLRSQSEERVRRDVAYEEAPSRLLWVWVVTLLLLAQGTARAQTARARHAGCRTPLPLDRAPVVSAW